MGTQFSQLANNMFDVSEFWFSSEAFQMFETPLVRINMSKFITFSLLSKDTHELAGEPKILFFSFVGFDVNTTGALYVVMW